MSGLEAIGGDVEGALERVNVPAYVIDASGVIRWLNAAALGIVGDVRGRQFTTVVAPEDLRLSRELFAQKVAGAVPVTDAELVLVDAKGERVAVEVSSVPLMRGERIIGVFGQLLHHPVEPTPAHPALTPRQSEVLRLLEHGRSTRQIAEELHLSPETVRNHVRAVLRASVFTRGSRQSRSRVAGTSQMTRLEQTVPVTPPLRKKCFAAGGTPSGCSRRTFRQQST